MIVCPHQNSTSTGDPSHTTVSGAIISVPDPAVLLVIVTLLVICEYPNSTSPPLAVTTCVSVSTVTRQPLLGRGLF